MRTTLHERHRQELKALLEEEKETRAERKQLEAQYKQREDAMAARLEWTIEWMEREGIRLPEQRESAEAAEKQDEKRYRENAKEKRKKKADAAQAGERAFSGKLNCLVEGNESLLETLSFGFEVSPTT